MFSDIIFDYIEGYKFESGCDRGNIEHKTGLGIKKDKYEILSDDEVEKYGKPKGKYELISIPDVLYLLEEDIKVCISEVASSIKNMIGNITPQDKVLIVGLGNRHISSDSLGTKVVGGINITIENKHIPRVMAISPSVMGLTGIETVDIVNGVVSKVKPTHVILIDSLCASSVERLGRSIQITNNGICPGGGIGNKRKCIDRNLAENVFSIGVPLLIYASTFVSETLDNHGINFEVINTIMQKHQNINNNGDFLNIIKSLNKILSDDVNDIIVSIKDIEECVSILSKIISSAINIALGVDK